MSDEPIVLHLITRFLDGGAETTTRNTLDALATDDYRYDLRLGTGAKHNPDRLDALESDGIETIVFWSLRHYNPVTTWVAVLSIAWYLHRESVDVLHTHSTEAGIVGRWAGAIARTPVVIHEIHGDPIADDHHRLLNAFIFAAERATAAITDRFIIKSERIHQQFLDRGIGCPDQYELIYHGVNLERFRTNTQETSNEGRNEMHRMNAGCANESPFQLLFVGRLADGKGLDDLLTAVEQLDCVSLWIAGDGPLSERVASAIESNDLPVEMLGYRNDVPSLMAAADVLVLPSYREGTPRVITEALASGLPVVSTSIAGIPEQVADGETGFLIEPGDVDALVDRLQQLQNPSLRQRFSDQAASSVEKFSQETAAKQYRQLYRDILN